jgi:hypothetical protein
MPTAILVVLAPPISAYGSYVRPRAACAPVWRCGYQGLQLAVGLRTTS